MIAIMEGKMISLDGPWQIEDGYIWVKQPGDPGVEDKGICIGKLFRSEPAYLIADAPELLEALEYLVKIPTRLSGEQLATARAAIAKARGEQPQRPQARRGRARVDAQGGRRAEAT